MKRTHKLRAMGDAVDVIANAKTAAEACERLGIDKSTLFRWTKAGKVPAVGSARAGRTDAATTEPVPSGDADAWAATVKKQNPDMSPTDLQLLELARLALSMAHKVSPWDAPRLAAMTRFQALVKQLNLTAEATALPAVPQPRPASVARPRASVGDPRRALMAVVNK